MLWWKKFVAWCKGEELRSDHIVSQLTGIVKQLGKYSDGKAAESDQASTDAERALARKVECEAERIKADNIMKKVRALYE